MKIRSLYELDDALDQDLAWRKHEISTIVGQVSSSRKSAKITLMRAAIALMYSHWEGHVKNASEIYLTYLNSISPKYIEMKDNFKHISLRSRFEEGFSIKEYSSQKEIYEYISFGLNCNFNINEKHIVKTNSNLKSDVFRNIMEQLGLKFNDLELKSNFIDQVLLNNRNCIAHGERLNPQDITSAYDNIKEEIIEMLEVVNRTIKNAASNREYLKDCNN
ncbi:MAE_28990/MAE_18760 family HEPN-like nuclease [Proteus vulgaris]|uniref:MAE_28990/MAE_18760 family HEPN-like nuclease n=1 Tax=Proteus vulgaris TaxID=585 RepID=UPI002541C4AB|nr:MAE_28990/MAE_18760 family HEPN-like nuclease [Proteus vulgaris]WIF73704.1 MAE_28990/MAE_18760 family HEPN-like nuclease [Proteus vulgaris]